MIYLFLSMIYLKYVMYLFERTVLHFHSNAHLFADASVFDLQASLWFLGNQSWGEFVEFVKFWHLAPSERVSRWRMLASFQTQLVRLRPR